jgi:hypothetical protein
MPGDADRLTYQVRFGLSQSKLLRSTQGRSFDKLRTNGSIMFVPDQ